MTHLVLFSRTAGAGVVSPHVALLWQQGPRFLWKSRSSRRRLRRRGHEVAVRRNPVIVHKQKKGRVKIMRVRDYKSNSIIFYGYLYGVPGKAHARKDLVK